MTSIINDVRELMTHDKTEQMNLNDMLKKLAKGPKQYKMKKEELIDVINHYKKLNVVFMDADENVFFL